MLRNLVFILSPARRVLAGDGLLRLSILKASLGSGVGGMGCTRITGEAGDQFGDSYNCLISEGRLDGCQRGDKDVETVFRGS